jgi:hypothetical protein
MSSSCWSPVCEAGNRPLFLPTRSSNDVWFASPSITTRCRQEILALALPDGQRDLEASPRLKPRNLRPPTPIPSLFATEASLPRNGSLSGLDRVKKPSLFWLGTAAVFIDLSYLRLGDTWKLDHPSSNMPCNNDKYSSIQFMLYVANLRSLRETARKCQRL